MEFIGVNVGTAVAYLTLDRSGFGNGLKSAGAELKSFATGSGNAQEKVNSLGNSFQSAGKAMVKPAIAVGGFLGLATKTATDFQAQMGKVGAISGATDEEIEKLSKTAREWGAKTKFSATEAGQALEYMGMAGWKTQEMTEGLPGILNLAAASGEELGTTSDIVTDALTAFGLKAKDSAEFADLLTSASTNSNTNVSMLGESFKYCAPVCGALGISAKDTALALGLMANSGIKGSNSGTALRSAFTNLANPTKSMQGIMDQLNITLTDGNGKVKEGKVLYDELREKFGGLSEAEKAAAASTLFGKEAMSGMLAIINASDDDYNKLYKNLSNCGNAAENTANKMQNNLKGALDNLKSAFEEMQLSLVDTILPLFTKIIKAVTGLINKFNALPKPIKDLIGNLLLVTAISATMLLLFGKMVKSISGLMGAFSILGKGVKTVLGSFKLLSTGISGVVKSFGALKNGAKIFSLLPSLITPHTLIVVAAIAGIGLIVYEVIKHWDGLKKAASNMLEHLTNACGAIGKMFGCVIEGWKILWHGFTDFMKNVGTWICDGLLGGLKKGFDNVIGFIHDMGSGIKNTFKKVLGINSPSRVFKEYGGFIGEGLIEGIDGQENVINTRFKGLANKIKGLGNVKPNYENFGLNDIALSGGYNNSSSLANASKSFQVTQDIKMYITIPNANQKGATELANEFKSQTEMSLKNSMVDLFMKDALRN